MTFARVCLVQLFTLNMFCLFVQIVTVWSATDILFLCLDKVECLARGAFDCY